MTLTDLYNRLDWSGPDETIRKWEVEKAMAEGSDPLWQRTFRSAIIYEALYGEEKERRTESIGFLRRLGIWDQIVRILHDEGIISSPGENGHPSPIRE